MCTGTVDVQLDVVRHVVGSSPNCCSTKRRWVCDAPKNLSALVMSGMRDFSCAARSVKSPGSVVCTSCSNGMNGWE